MAERRMFAASVIESDGFLDLKPEAQALYFHLGMYADDDGVVDSPRKIMRIIGFGQESIESLIDAGFLLRFENNFLVITDWKKNNYLQSDRYHKSVFQDVTKQLYFDPGTKRYSKKTQPSEACIHNVSDTETSSIHSVSKMENEYSIGKGSLDKIRKEKNPSPSAISFESEIPKDYVPQYWEVKIPKFYWSRFKTEDEYYEYAAAYSDEVEQHLEEQ